jgi:hypothetical protein
MSILRIAHDRKQRNRGTNSLYSRLCVAIDDCLLHLVSPYFSSCDAASYVKASLFAGEVHSPRPNQKGAFPRLNILHSHIILKLLSASLRCLCLSDTKLPSGQVCSLPLFVPQLIPGSITKLHRHHVITRYYADHASCSFVQSTHLPRPPFGTSAALLYTMLHQLLSSEH